MKKEKQTYGITELPTQFDNRSRTQKEYNQELSVENAKRGDIVKKNHTYYQNERNMWNNSYHSSKKKFEQYHQTKQKKEAILNKKIERFDHEDKQNAHNFKRKFVLESKSQDADKMERFKMNRLVLQGKCKQKVFQTNQLEETCSKLENLDRKSDNDLTQMKSSDYNRIRTKSVWNDREKLNEKRLKFDLTEKVMRGERNAIEMISKRFKQDNVAVNIQKKSLTGKANQVRETFKKQQSDNVSNSLKVSYPEDSMTNPINQSTKYNSLLNTTSNWENTAKTLNMTTNSLNFKAQQQQSDPNFMINKQNDDVFNKTGPANFMPSKSVQNKDENKRTLHKNSTDTQVFHNTKKELVTSTSKLHNYKNFDQRYNEEISKRVSNNRVLEPFKNNPDLEKPEPISKRCMPFVISPNQQGAEDDWKPRTVSELKKYRDTWEDKTFTHKANHFMTNNLRQNIEEYNSYDNSARPIHAKNKFDRENEADCRMSRFLEKYQYVPPDEFKEKIKFDFNSDSKVWESKCKPEMHKPLDTFNTLETFKSEQIKKAQLNGTAHPQTDLSKSKNVDTNRKNYIKDKKARFIDDESCNEDCNINCNSNDTRIAIDFCKDKRSMSTSSEFRFGRKKPNLKSNVFDLSQRSNNLTSISGPNSAWKVNNSLKPDSKGFEGRTSSKSLALKKYTENPNDLLGNADFNGMMTKSVNQLKLDQDNKFINRMEKNFISTKNVFDENKKSSYVVMGYAGVMKKKNTGSFIMPKQSALDDEMSVEKSIQLDFAETTKYVDNFVEKLNDYSSSNIDAINNPTNTFSQLKNFMDMKTEMIRFNPIKFKQYPAIKLDLYHQHMEQIEKCKKDTGYQN